MRFLAGAHTWDDVISFRLVFVAGWVDCSPFSLCLFPVSLPILAFLTCLMILWRVLVGLQSSPLEILWWAQVGLRSFPFDSSSAEKDRPPPGDSSTGEKKKKTRKSRCGRLTPLFASLLLVYVACCLLGTASARTTQTHPLMCAASLDGAHSGPLNATSLHLQQQTAFSLTYQLPYSCGASHPSIPASATQLGKKCSSNTEGDGPAGKRSSTSNGQSVSKKLRTEGSSFVSALKNNNKYLD